MHAWYCPVGRGRRGPNITSSFNVHLVSCAGAPPGAKKDANPTVMGQSTVIKMPRATDDKTVTAMVPAALRVRRDQNAMRLRAVGRPGVAAAAGFGLLPALEKPAPAAAPKPAVPAETDKKYQDFLAEMSALGALA